MDEYSQNRENYSPVQGELKSDKPKFMTRKCAMRTAELIATEKLIKMGLDPIHVYVEVQNGKVKVTPVVRECDTPDEEIIAQLMDEITRRMKGTIIVKSKHPKKL